MGISLSPVKRSRWMDWRPKPCIFTESVESQPTKPSKPGSVGFEGATSAKAAEINAFSCEGEAYSEPAAVAQQSVAPTTEPREVWMTWCDWKAAALNRLFQEQGATGQPGRITGATVLHGEKKMKGKKEDAEDL